MSELITETQPATAPKRYQCRHIHADGHRCGSPSLKQQTFCYYHHTTRKPIPRAALIDRYKNQDRRAAFDLPLPEDRPAIQLAIGEVLRRIAANQLDTKRAGQLLYGLQIASLNLPPHPRPAAEAPTQLQQTIEEIVEDETYGPLAPEAELTPPAHKKDLYDILMEQWAKDKQERLEEEQAKPKQTYILEALQAVADGCPMITLSPNEVKGEGLSWGKSLPNIPPPTHPRTHKKSRIPPSSLILVTPCPPTPTTAHSLSLPMHPCQCHARPMKTRAILSTLLLASTTAVLAQEQGIWRPVSKTAQSITGEIVLGAERLTINFSGFAASQIRPLKPAEISAAFDGADATTGIGHLYRLSIPGDKRFLHKNTLCGSDETQWMVTYVSGKQLELAFFSNATPPALTIDGMNNNPNMCGTYTYSR